MHRITAVTLVLALAAGGCAGANPPLETSYPPMARQSPTGTADELRRLAGRLPHPRPRPGHPSRGLRRRLRRRRRQRGGGPARRPAGRVHQADLGIPRRRRLRRPGSRPAAPAAPQLGQTLAAIERTLRRRRRRGAGDLGHGDQLRREPRLDAGDREPGHPRLRGPPPRLGRGAADRRAPHPPGRRRHARGAWSAPGPARWATPSSCRRASSPPPSTSPATAAATSGARTRPTRWPRPPTTSPRPAGAAARPGGWRCGCRKASTTARPTSRTAARPPTGAPAASPGSTARPCPTTARWRSSPPPARRGPAFAIYENFFVIKSYNNATSYALGVGHLGDRIAGGGSDRRRLAARRARAVAHREDRAAGAADRPRLRDRQDRRRDRPGHHQPPSAPGRAPTA